MKGKKAMPLAAGTKPSQVREHGGSLTDSANQREKGYAWTSIEI